jgi:hypothetical protein
MTPADWVLIAWLSAGTVGAVLGLAIAVLAIGGGDR